MKTPVVVSVHKEYVRLGLPADGTVVRYNKEEVSCAIADLTALSLAQDGAEDAIRQRYGEADFIFLAWDAELWNALYKNGIPFVFIMPENCVDDKLLEFEKKQRFNEVGGKNFGATMDMFKRAMDMGYDAFSDDLAKHPSYKILLNNVQVPADVLGKLYARKTEYPFLYTREEKR